LLPLCAVASRALGVGIGKAPLPSLQTVLSRGRRLNGGRESRQGSEDLDDLSKPLRLLTSSSNRPAATDVPKFELIAAATAPTITCSARGPSDRANMYGNARGPSGLANTGAMLRRTHRSPQRLYLS